MRFLAATLLIANVALANPTSPQQRNRIANGERLYVIYQRKAKEILERVQGNGDDGMNVDAAIAYACIQACAVGRELYHGLGRVISLEDEPQAKDDAFRQKLEALRGELAGRLSASCGEGAVILKTLEKAAEDKELREHLELMVRVEQNTRQYLKETEWITKPKRETKADAPAKE